MPFPLGFLCGSSRFGKAVWTIRKVSVVILPRPSQILEAIRGAMQNNRALDGVWGLWPLAFCMIYFLNPRRSYEFIYAIVFSAGTRNTVENPGSRETALCFTAQCGLCPSHNWNVGHISNSASWSRRLVDRNILGDWDRLVALVSARS